MNKKSDISKVKILEYIALVGELTSEEIKAFSKSPSYAEKIITALKKDSYIKKFKGEEKSTYRLTSKGKSFLKEVLPDVFDDQMTGQKTMNRVRNDKRRNERRDKLAELLLMFQRADIKILPDEKQLLRNTIAADGADRADDTDNDRPEFYTSAEIKNIIPDYKAGIGSRCLGVLIAYEKLYIVYSTVDGDLFWRKDTERNFYTKTKDTLAKILFGKNNGTYMLVLADKEKTAATIMNRCDGKSRGKIMPVDDIPMLFAVKDIKKDATLKFILTDDHTPIRLKEIFSRELEFDKAYSDFDGVRKIKYRDLQGNITERETYYLSAFWFDINKVYRAVEAGVKNNRDICILCFDYQKEYIDIFIKSYAGDRAHRVEVLSNSLVDYKENYLQ